MRKNWLKLFLLATLIARSFSHWRSPYHWRSSYHWRSFIQFTCCLDGVGWGCPSCELNLPPSPRTRFNAWRCRLSCRYFFRSLGIRPWASSFARACRLFKILKRGWPSLLQSQLHERSSFFTCGIASRLRTSRILPPTYRLAVGRRLRRPPRRPPDWLSEATEAGPRLKN